MTKPLRLQLSRKKGFNLQASSIAANGFTAVNVARPGKWGNPYYPGSGIGYGFFDEKMQPCSYHPTPDVCVRWFRFRMDGMRQHEPEEYARFIGPLRGQNLACWCDAGAPCHADVLLELANGEAA